MSKRYPLSRASKTYSTLLDRYPEYSKSISSLLAPKDPAVAYAAAKAIGREMNGAADALGSDRGALLAEAYRHAATDPGLLMPDDLVWMSRWRSCRQVFRIDPAVAAELPATEIDEEIPCEVLTRLPYPIIYVERPFKAPSTLCGEVDVAGFLAYAVEWTDGSTRIGITMITASGGRFYTSLPTDFDRSLRDLVTEMVGVADGDGTLRPVTAGEMEGSESYDRSVSSVRTIVDSLLYIISAEDDKEVVYAPPRVAKGSKPGRKTNPETVNLVGAKMGRAIGKVRAGAPASASAHATTGRTVAPHMRAAHWQHFWIGKRKARDDGRFGDELVLKWVPPVPVNENSGEAIETIHV